MREHLLVDQPEIVPAAVVAPLFSTKDQRTHRLFGVEQFLLVPAVQPDQQASASPDPA